MIAEYSFAYPELTERLQLDPDNGKAQLFYFTLGELDDLIGYVAAESNHASKKARHEWSTLYDRMARLLDSYAENRSED